MELSTAITFIQNFKAAHPDADKAAVQAAFVKQYRPTRSRAVHVFDNFSVRFSQASGKSFYSAVISLSALKKHDTRPFLVALTRDEDVRFYLANTTFLKRISHSSQGLTSSRIVGSFLGSDIMKEYEGMENTPNNFDLLFARHRTFSWEKNLHRLVESTAAIVGRGKRFRLSAIQLEILEKAPERAAALLQDSVFGKIETKLTLRVRQLRKEILRIADVENASQRGKMIEEMITGSASTRALGDMEYRPNPETSLVIDIKTWLTNKKSSPKAYNIDKMLAYLSVSGSASAFLFVGLNPAEEAVSARLLPTLDSVILKATSIRPHWAGRGSRGTAQLSGRFKHTVSPDYRPVVDLVQGREFIKKLLAL